MSVNGFCDGAVGSRDRPGRTIQAGEIRAATVSWIGFGLLATGIVLMVPFGLVPMIWGALLAAVIVLYDVWHKGNALSPIVMGLCRALVYIGTGAAVFRGSSPAPLLRGGWLGRPAAGHTPPAHQAK